MDESFFIVKIPESCTYLLKICHITNEKDFQDLNIRFWECPACGHAFQRERNAEVNLREEGKRIFLPYVRDRLVEIETAREKAENQKASR